LVTVLKPNSDSANNPDVWLRLYNGLSIELSSIFRRDGNPPAPALELPPVTLGRQPLLLCFCGWSGRSPQAGFLSGFANQPDQTVDGVLTIALLGSMPSGVDDQDAFGRHTPAGDPPQSVANACVQSRAPVAVETQLNGGGYLVDVLATGPRRPYKGKLEFIFIQADAFRYVNHILPTDPICLSVNILLFMPLWQ